MMDIDGLSEKPKHQFVDDQPEWSYKSKVGKFLSFPAIEPAVLEHPFNIDRVRNEESHHVTSDIRVKVVKTQYLCAKY